MNNVTINSVYMLTTENSQVSEMRKTIPDETCVNTEQFGVGVFDGSRPYLGKDGTREIGSALGNIQRSVMKIDIRHYCEVYRHETHFPGWDLHRSLSPPNTGHLGDNRQQPRIVTSLEGIRRELSQFNTSCILDGRLLFVTGDSARLNLLTSIGTEQAYKAEQNNAIRIRGQRRSRTWGYFSRDSSSKRIADDGALHGEQSLNDGRRNERTIIVRATGMRSCSHRLNSHVYNAISTSREAQDISLHLILPAATRQTILDSTAGRIQLRRNQVSKFRQVAGTFLPSRRLRLSTGRHSCIGISLEESSFRFRHLGLDRS